LTTTLKILQVMAEKGLVVRDDGVRPQLYAPAKPEEATQAGLLADLADRAFGGSVRRLLVRAVEEGELTREELDEIRALIDSVRKDRSGR
jgi:predicted transcriptional regulator